MHQWWSHDEAWLKVFFKTRGILFDVATKRCLENYFDHLTMFWNCSPVPCSSRIFIFTIRPLLSSTSTLSVNLPFPFLILTWVFPLHLTASVAKATNPRWLILPLLQDDFTRRKSKGTRGQRLRSSQGRPSGRVGDVVISQVEKQVDSTKTCPDNHH
jgi:hypothetical protein